MKPTTTPSAEAGILSRWWPFVILCCFWLLPGLIGHDPWKADEPYSFGMVYHIITTGDWVVPTVAGVPFMEKPPLFYISAAFLAKMVSPLLPLHDGARLACAPYMIVTFVFTGLAARELWGRGTGRTAVLVLMGCVGLLNHAHKLITDVSLLTGFTVGLYGLALGRRRWLAGGFWAGTGIGIGFMSKGLLAPGMMGIIALVVPVWCREWRNREYFLSLGAALGASLPWVLIWPLALYLKAPLLFREWFWDQNFGRFFGFSPQGEHQKPGFYLFHLTYLAWPALPLSVWTVWRRWRSGEAGPFRTFPLAAFATMFVVLSLASYARGNYALPMLVPLSLLAVPAVAPLPPGVRRAADRSGIVLFGVSALLFWAGWVILQTGAPLSIVSRLHRESPGYVPHFEPVPFAAALVATILWGIAVAWRDDSGEGVLFRWSAGMALVWALMMTLWLSWTDAARSYRSMVQELRKCLPPSHVCIGGKSLGESERAMFDYLGGIRTIRVDDPRTATCDLLLVGGTKGNVPAGIGPAWRTLWAGSRPGHEKELFSLYQLVRTSEKGTP